MTNDPEFLTIDRILAGETGLYAGLVDRYKRYVYTIAMKVLQSRPDAEEAAQDTFIKAFHALASFNKQSKFSTWLYRIAFNTAISNRRKRRNFQSIEQASSVAANESEGLLEKKDKKAYVQMAMARLNEADRTALTLFYLEEFSLEEIAEITGTQANTMKVRIHRARMRMAEELKNILNEEALTL